MEKKAVLEVLRGFKDKLTGEVLEAYQTRGSSYGRERFSSWRKKFSRFLDEHLPGESAKLNAKLKHFAFVVLRGESDAEMFWREDGEIVVAFIDSLIKDISSDEYEPTEEMRTAETESSKDSAPAPSRKIFVVHGHDDEAKTKTARFIEKLGYEVVILHEQASGGRTIIEKIEAYSDVGFAIVIYTPDDKGNTKDDADKGQLNNRARQNVVFEHGYLVGKLGRSRVVPLVLGELELPTDISGVVYISDRNWQIDIAKEIKAAGYDIDVNRLL